MKVTLFRVNRFFMQDEKIDANLNLLSQSTHQTVSNIPNFTGWPQKVSLVNFRNHIVSNASLIIH
jgi:hypothetical protein